jgi:glycine/D-amino acid oxidase-like deaminating enzyme
MKALVIGSRLIGLTSAYFLRHAGHEVTVIAREEGPGRETSFANGALPSRLIGATLAAQWSETHIDLYRGGTWVPSHVRSLARCRASTTDT